MTVHNEQPHGTSNSPQPTDVPATDGTVVAGAGQPGRVIARVPGSAPQGAGRDDRVLTWVGWHLGELTAITVPVVLAVSVHPLWMVPAAAVATAWAANEVRLRHHRTPDDRQVNGKGDSASTGVTGKEVRHDGLA